ncbi:MAG TPA: NosD domain-containing protein [Solirubrobacteraceae bacterium]|nr:NosD domain-containing protein [Solirubrobacteraceae bacterium]
MIPQPRRAVLVAPALALLLLVLPSTAFGQATRTWVSGVGDDANPCSRTAPCRTFAGAISKTAAGGEMNAIDPGAFGPVNINKSLTIRSQVEAGILASGTNGIVVNAAPTDKVVLDGLDIHGAGTGAPTSLVGIKVLQARAVQIRRTDISRMQAGIAVVPNAASSTRVTITDSHVYNNGVGIFNGPSIATSPFAVTVVRRSLIAENTCGVVAASTGPNATTPNAGADCGSAAGPLNQVSAIELFDSGIHDNDTGVYARGAASLVDLSENYITGHSAFGLRSVGGGQLRSFSSNVIVNNGASDVPTVLGKQ